MKSGNSKLLSLDASDMKPTSLNYSKGAQYVNSESVSPNMGRSDLTYPKIDRSNPYLNRTETPKLNALAKSYNRNIPQLNTDDSVSGRN
jgi:hypothetical protein